MAGKPEAINLSEVIPHQILPTDKFFTKKDSSGNVINKFPGLFAVRCEYRGNKNYVFFATEKEVAEIRGVTRKEYDELCGELNSLRSTVEELKAFVD
jgi:hypothetical protein